MAKLAFLLAAVLLTAASAASTAPIEQDSITAKTGSTLRAVDGVSKEASGACGQPQRRLLTNDAVNAGERAPKCCGECSAGGKDGCWISPEGKPSYCSAC